MNLARTALPALAIAGALLAAGCGSDNSADGSRTAAPGNPVDRALVAHMIPHHQSAVQMAKIAQHRGQSAFVKRLAADIVRTQTKEIAAMRAEDQRLQRAGVKQGSLGVPEHMMGMNGDVASLKTAKPFDRAFLRMMIPHHEGSSRHGQSRARQGQGTRPQAAGAEHHRHPAARDPRDAQAARRHKHLPPPRGACTAAATPAHRTRRAWRA